MCLILINHELIVLYVLKTNKMLNFLNNLFHLTFWHRNYYFFKF